MDIFELMDMGENSEIEFKKAKNSVPKDLWETYSAMANTNCGTIVLGVEDRLGEAERFSAITTDNFFLFIIFLPPFFFFYYILLFFSLFSCSTQFFILPQFYCTKLPTTPKRKLHTSKHLNWYKNNINVGKIKKIIKKTRSKKVIPTRTNIFLTKIIY